MARLACIIPVLGTTDGLETTLVSVLERRPDDCELAVVLNVPYDDPYQLSGEVKFLDAPRGAGLVQCLNLGIAATRAPIVHTLACGYEVADGWLDGAAAHFADPRVAVVAPSIYDTADRERLVASGIRYHCGGSKSITPNEQAAIGPLLQAAFVRREALAAFDGILPATVGDELADVDLALTLHAAGWQIRFESGCRVFAPAIERPQAVGFGAARAAERLFWRHWAETGRVSGLASHPWTVMKSIVASGGKAPMTALGRLIGLCEFGAVRSYRQTLAKAAAVVEEVVAERQWHEADLRRGELSVGGQSLRIDQPHPTGRAIDQQPVRNSRRKAARG